MAGLAAYPQKATLEGSAFEVGLELALDIARQCASPSRQLHLERGVVLFDKPLLMIHGKMDDVVPAWNHADRLMKLLPQAEPVELPETGHAPHHVRTEEVASTACRAQ